MISPTKRLKSCLARWTVYEFKQKYKPDVLTMCV